MGSAGSTKISQRVTRGVLEKRRMKATYMKIQPCVAQKSSSRRRVSSSSSPAAQLGTRRTSSEVRFSWDVRM